MHTPPLPESSKKRGLFNIMHIMRTQVNPQAVDFKGVTFVCVCYWLLSGLKLMIWEPSRIYDTPISYHYVD